MQQVKNALSERVLSKKISDEFCEFFTGILRQALRYYQENTARPVFIVVITRRCFVLFFAYYEILCKCVQNPAAYRPAAWKNCDLKELQQLAQIFEKCVITDNAAWAMAYDIVQCYYETSIFPTLIVADELLFHGRALNGFLYGFEKRLQYAENVQIERLGATTSVRNSIQSEFLDNLSIRVANRNVGSSVLLPRYEKILARDTPNAKLPIEAWRNYSIAYAQYVSICGINNVGFTIGFSISPRQDPSIAPRNDSQFTKISTQLQNIDQDTWLYFYPSVSQPRIICTIRYKQSQTEEKRNLYVPYIIVDHISLEQLMKLHRELLCEAQISGKEKIATLLGRADDLLSTQEDSAKSLLVPWLTQTTDLVLTTWLMKCFLREIKGASQEQIATIWKDSIGWKQLAGSFCSYSVSKTTQNETIDALEELWSWEPARPLQDYLSIYSANAQSISVDWMDLRPISTNTTLNENALLVQCLEDTISKVGLEAERNAYTLYGSGFSFSDEALSNWGDNHSIDTLLKKLRAQMKTYALTLNTVNVYEVMAVITQAMDLGLLGMNTIFERQPCADLARYESSSYELYTRQRAGEAALFLLPIRYRNLLPVLSGIQEKRKDDLDGAIFDLTRFIDILAKSEQLIQITNDLYMPVTQLKHSLCCAYEMLVLGGQKFKEWQCNLYDRRLSIESQDAADDTNRRLRMHFLLIYRNL